MKTLIMAIALIGFSTSVFAQQYSQRVDKDPYGATVVAPKVRNERSFKTEGKNPYGATVVAPKVRNENSFKVNKKKHKIKKDKKHMTNPTGQVSDEEFDQLLRGSRNRGNGSSNRGRR